MKIRWKGFVATAGLVMLAASPVASAAVGPYVGIEGGASLDIDTNVYTGGNKQTVKFHNGLVGGATVGYALPGHLRPELEINYRRNTIKNGGGAFSAIAMMGNLWYDYDTRSSYFYLGAGIGDAHLKLSLSQPHASDSDDGFAYQFGAGAGYFINPHLAVGVDYRYLQTAARGSFDFGSAGTKARFRSQTVMLGLRYNFGEIWNPLAPRQAQTAPHVVPLSGSD